MKDPLATYLAGGGDEKALLNQLAHNEKLAELGRLSAALIHELNTPLSVVISATQLILREEGLSDFVREMVERINQEAHRLSQQTRGILSFSREGEVEGETDVNTVIHEVALFLRYEAQKRSINLVDDLDHRLHPVAVDGNRLKQIIINLVMNAIQAIGEGGTILMRTLPAADGRVEIQIADTGPGISAEIRERMFEPFFTTKEAGEGTGLGLYITKQLVEHFSGSISVVSAVGEGTTFLLRFPTR